MVPVTTVLNHDVTSTSYMFVFCIVFYLHKIKAYGQVITISDEDYQTLYNQTTEILNNYKFYSISERNFILGKEVHNINEKIEQILSSFNYDNATYIEQILTQLMIASDINIESTNKQLRAFSDNLNWDLGFMLKIISMDFSKLKETSFSNKKELLGKISQLIEEYNELPANQNKIEKY